MSDEHDETIRDLAQTRVELAEVQNLAALALDDAEWAESVANEAMAVGLAAVEAEREYRKTLARAGLAERRALLAAEEREASLRDALACLLTTWPRCDTRGCRAHAMRHDGEGTRACDAHADSLKGHHDQIVGTGAVRKSLAALAVPGTTAGEPEATSSEFWQIVRDASAEVATWPEWKRGAVASVLSPRTNDAGRGGEGDE